MEVVTGYGKRDLDRRRDKVICPDKKKRKK